MKKIFLLVAAVVLLGAGCVKVATQQPIQTDKQNTAVQPVVETKKTVTSFVYTSTPYGFSLNFPSSWGNIKEKVANGPSGSKILRVITLTSENDPSTRNLTIDVVNTADKNHWTVTDAPHTYITGNKVYSYYYSGSQDYAGAPGVEADENIQKEVKEIVASFELL